MFDVSLPWANFWYDAFNVLLFVGAFAVAVGTYGSIKMGAVKEKFADERIIANEAETKRAIADSDSAKEGAAKANQRIAELSTQAEQLRKDTADANARALEAQLALEKFKQPRSLSERQIETIASKLKQFAGTRFDAYSSGVGRLVQ
jgi:chromosome segregation ATPase